MSRSDRRAKTTAQSSAASTEAASTSAGPAAPPTSMSTSTTTSTADATSTSMFKRKRTHAPDENSTPAKKPATHSHPHTTPAPTRPVQHDYNEAISHMDSGMLSDLLAQTLKRHAGQRTTIELEEQFIPASAIRDSSTFSQARVSKHLPAFLEHIHRGPQSLSTCTDVASPHTIIITASGIRAADLTRDVRSLATGDGKVAKLFAKHMKLQATIDFVTKTKIIIGVGTPTRLKELIDQGALQTAGVQQIVIDGSYVDEKRRSIFDIKEIYLPMLDFLNSARIKDALAPQETGAKIVIF